MDRYLRWRIDKIISGLENGLVAEKENETSEEWKAMLKLQYTCKEGERISSYLYKTLRMY